MSEVCEALRLRSSEQLRGLLWKDGGPVIGIQLENEYAEARGPKRGDEYILALKELAIRSGLDVPLYTVTGWDNAVVPQRACAAGVWRWIPGCSLGRLARGSCRRAKSYRFRFGSRVCRWNMGSDESARNTQRTLRKAMPPTRLS